MNRIRIVAECAQNHGGDMDIAFSMISQAKDAGCDAVKFQLLKADLLFGKLDPLYEQVKEAELNIEQLVMLKKHAEYYGLDFIVTPFYLEAVDELESIGLKTYKIREKDSGNMLLIEKVLATNKPVIISTQERPTDIGLKYHPNITWIYCIPSYPTKLEQIQVMKALLFQGFSDHTPSITAALALSAIAIHRGQDYLIEKHVMATLPADPIDYDVSVTFGELSELVSSIQEFQEMRDWNDLF